MVGEGAKLPRKASGSEATAVSNRPLYETDILDIVVVGQILWHSDRPTLKGVLDILSSRLHDGVSPRCVQTPNLPIL